MCFDSLIMLFSFLKEEGDGSVETSVHSTPSLNQFERGVWFKYKACSFDPSGGVLLYVEHWAKLRNAVVETKTRSN